MPNFYQYNREQAYLLPPSVKERAGGKSSLFFVHRAVEKLDLREFEAAYSEEGQRAHHPAMQLKVWMYAYALVPQPNTECGAVGFLVPKK